MNEAWFYVVYVLVVGIYTMLGGFRAAALTDAIQGTLIVVFSVLLIPVGLSHIGGLAGLHGRVPAHMFQLFGSATLSDYAWYTVVAMVLANLVSIVAVASGMQTAGSATNEFAARIGMIGGMFLKRLLMLCWAFAGLLAVAIYSNGLHDPDLIWGVMTRDLLWPGAVGLMLVGVLSGSMSWLGASALSHSALFIRNLYKPWVPDRSDRHYLVVGRIMVAVTLVGGILVALVADNLLGLFQYIISIPAIFGASIWLGFLWRRVTRWAVILQVATCLVVYALVPTSFAAMEWANRRPAFLAETAARSVQVVSKATTADVAQGRAAKVGDPVKSTREMEPVGIFFDRVARTNPADPASPRVGLGRFNAEVWIAELVRHRLRPLEQAAVAGRPVLLRRALPVRPARRVLVRHAPGAHAEPRSLLRARPHAGPGDRRGRPGRGRSVLRGPRQVRLGQALPGHRLGDPEAGAGRLHRLLRHLRPGRRDPGVAVRDGEHPMSADAARKRPLVGIDNYGLFPLNLAPLATLRWAEAHGAEGVAFSGLQPEHQAGLDASALERLKDFAGERGLYLEWGGAQHVPRDLVTWSPKSIVDDNCQAIRQALALGARVVRSCSGGLMRWHDDAPATETLLGETAQALREQAAMWQDAGVTLAIETHFEFTSHELLRLFEMCEARPGGWVGICLDTMNLLTMLEEPVAATRRLLPWVVSTHIKDGAIALGSSGFTTFPTPLGSGIVDLPAIVDLVASLDRPVHFSVEDHGGSFALPVFDPAFLSKFPDLTAQEFRSLTALAERTARQPSCQPLPREQWPRVAETRMAADLAALAALVEQRSTAAAAGSV